MDEEYYEENENAEHIIDQLTPESRVRLMRILSDMRQISYPRGILTEALEQLDYIERKIAKGVKLNPRFSEISQADIENEYLKYLK